VSGSYTAVLLRGRPDETPLRISNFDVSVADEQVLKSPPSRAGCSGRGRRRAGGGAERAGRL